MLQLCCLVKFAYVLIINPTQRGQGCQKIVKDIARYAGTHP